MERTARGADCAGGVWPAGRLPQWLGHDPGPWAVVVWVPLILLEPMLSAGATVLGWLTILAVAVTFVGAVLAAGRPSLRERYVPELLLIAEFGLTAAATRFGPHWYVMFVLLAIGVGALISPRWFGSSILTVAGVSVALVTARSGWDQAWVTALTVLLSGASTFLFYRLFLVIAELNRTREELARTAVSEERLRFARDLHDLLGHTLSVMVVKAEVVRRLIPRDPELAGEHARDIETLGRQGLAEVRQAVNGYRDLTLGGELTRARNALSDAGIVAQIVEADRALPPDVDTLLGWVVREGVTNVIRHSGADRCTITVRVGGGTARLDLTDDGHGTDPGPDGGGLRGLRERVAAAGGTVEAGRLPNGFGIAVDLPCPELVDTA
ncbi:MAG TPA: histidine kinase [Mycobacteriales bacterium]|nr:histidine kinase [Mycobacteriales bacterium]